MNLEIVNQSNLKCDKEGCDYIIDVPFEQFTEWINRPCPKCSSNLLTYDDYQNAKASMEAVDFINTLTPEQLVELGEACKDQVPEYLKEKLAKFSETDEVKFFVDTHNGIKITDIKKVDSE